MGDGFYRSKDPTNSMKVLKEEAVKEKTQRTKKTQITHARIPCQVIHWELRGYNRKPGKEKLDGHCRIRPEGCGHYTYYRG